jgi:hypothetical protein
MQWQSTDVGETEEEVASTELKVLKAEADGGASAQARWVELALAKSAVGEKRAVDATEKAGVAKATA